MPSAKIPRAQGETPPPLPLAEEREQWVDSPHGKRVDPYYWLRDDSRKDRKVRAFLRDHNRHTAQWFKAHGNRERGLYREIIARLQQEDSSVPYFKSGYWYYARYMTGKEHPLYARRAGSLDAAEQVMLDVNELASGHGYYDIGAIDVSPDARWMAYCEDNVGRREYTLRLKDLHSGETLPTQILNIEADLAWLNDSASLLYIAKDPKTLLGLYVKRHRIGAPVDTDELVFEQTDASFYTTVTKSKSDRFVFIGMESTVASEWRYAEAGAADGALQFHTVQPQQRDHEYQIEHWGEEFIVRTNWEAPNFRLMRVPVPAASVRTQWRELQPHRTDTFIHDFEVLANFIAVSERSSGLRKIRILPLLENLRELPAQEFFIAADEAAYTMTLGTNPSIDSDVLRYGYTSPKTPQSVFDYDLRTHQRTLMKQEKVLGGFDATRYATQFIRAPGRDGSAIPVSLVYRTDTPLDGTAPLLQYGYGAYGHSLDPGFSSSRLSLLDRGFVFALAHVRGGQELGRAWYDTGRLLNKKNTFNDFIDVTRHLVALKFAAKDRVFAMGGSAGGLLMGVVANLAPQDYRGIVAQVPFVDVVTTMLDETLPLTTNEYDEWGNPQDKALYDYMLSYSPYDNLKTQHYPALYVTTGLWDSQVQYFEPAKWVAKLAKMKTDSQPLLLHVDMSAGHGGKSGRFERYREIAREYAFVLSIAEGP